MSAPASLGHPAPAAPAADAVAWTGFELDGNVFALPNHCVERVLSATRVTPLPFAPPAVEGVASISGDVLPVLALRLLLSPERSRRTSTAPDFVVILVEGRRFALRVDRVLFISEALRDAEPEPETDPPSPVAALADWRGLPVTCLASEHLGIASLVPFLPPRGEPGPVVDHRIDTDAVATTVGETMLAVSAGGIAHGLRTVSVVEILENPAITPLPLAPAEIIGVAVVRGAALLTFSLARLLQREPDEAPTGFVVVRTTGGRCVLAVEGIGGLRRLSTQPLDLAALVGPKWLAVTMAAATPAPPRAPITRSRFLCVSLGARACALPLASVERVLPPRPPIRLPAGAPAGIDSAIEFAGRVIPLTEGWRWLSEPEGGPVAAHIVVHHEGERRALAVNAVQRMVTIPQHDILPTSDHDRRIAGFGRANGRSVAILSAAALVSA